MGEVERFSRIFEDAKNGGRHAGTYESSMSKTPSQLNKSIRSHEQQLAEHLNKINNPVLHSPDWGEISEMKRAGRVRYWQKEVDNLQDKLEIEKQVRKGRGING